MCSRLRNAAALSKNYKHGPKAKAMRHDLLVSAAPLTHVFQDTDALAVGNN